MHHFNEIKIPRWVNLQPGMISCQIHGFCDASTQAFGAVVYLRVTDTDGQIYTKLVISKTRVAPIKPVSMPRLELCGAVLLSRLIMQVKSDMQLYDVKTVSWSDSKIVLAWIKGHPNKWRTYVANRVVEIQENSKNIIWRYIPTKDNPADMASRGIMPSSLVHNSSWWNGPAWLSQSEHLWPTSNDVCETDLEIKSSQALLTTQQEDEFILLRKYSSFDKLLRIVAYCRRFINKSDFKQRNSVSYPTVRELKEATIAIVRCLQKQTFQTEYCLLQAGKPITTKSTLLRLNPFIDKEGVIRVGGRLEHSKLPYDIKHPIILPSKHHITDIIIHKYHKTTLHGGAQLVLNTLRMKYWIINGASTVKAKIYQCVTCARYRNHNQTQIMGNLPTERVTKARPFENTGLDYAGPIDLKMSKHRGAKIYKGYICIFVCMATKAIHIEAVSDLTSEAFLAAFKRFTSRRGLCTNLYSDNGTTFTGADRILKRELIQAIKEANEHTACMMASEGVNWHFNPPLAPHFGGLWEAGVKRVKYHLKRTIGSTVLTFEELSTLLTQIEAVLNSRPLCSITNDPTNLDVLTPGHFLIGKAITTPPEAHLVDENVHALKRWHAIQQIQQTFWKRWSHEYLTQLQQRQKWNRTKEDLKKGQVVLLKEERLPPGKWALGVIETAHPGDDGKTRVVTEFKKKEMEDILEINTSEADLVTPPNSPRAPHSTSTPRFLAYLLKDIPEISPLTTPDRGLFTALEKSDPAKPSPKQRYSVQCSPITPVQTTELKTTSPTTGLTSSSEVEPAASTSGFILEQLKSPPPKRLEEKKYDLTTTEGKQFQVTYKQMQSIPWDAIRSGKRKRYTLFLGPHSKVRLRIRKNKIIWYSYHKKV